MENELFSVLDEDAKDRNTHRACLRAVARAQKQFGSFFKQAASEDDYMARLELVRDRINDVVREACIEEGSTSLDTVARVLAGELARTSEVMRDTVKDEDVAPSEGEDDEMHVRGVAGRKLLGLDDQEGESKTAAPRRKPVPQMDEGTGRMYQPAKNPPRKKKAPADPNAADSLDPMKNKNVVRTPDGNEPMDKPVNQQQLDWNEKNKNKVRGESLHDAPTGKSLRELEGLAPLRPGELKADDEAAFLRAQSAKTAAPGFGPSNPPLTIQQHDQRGQDWRDEYSQRDTDFQLSDSSRSALIHAIKDHEDKAAELRKQLGVADDAQTWPPTDPNEVPAGTPGNGMTMYQGKKLAVETGDTYTQETVDLPKADANGLSEDPSPKMDKGTAGDENHTSQKPIDIPSTRHNPEVQDVTDPADYTATLETPSGVAKRVNPDSPMQPEHNVAPGSETFPNKDQANPITSKWKVLG